MKSSFGSTDFGFGQKVADSNDCFEIKFQFIPHFVTILGDSCKGEFVSGISIGPRVNKNIVTWYRTIYTRWWMKPKQMFSF